LNNGDGVIVNTIQKNPSMEIDDAGNANCNSYLLICICFFKFL